MDNSENNQHSNPVVLLWVAGFYATINIIGVSLAVLGIVHPPWDILELFSMPGPMILALGLLLFQIGAQRRFPWPVALASFAVIGLAALINFFIMVRALVAFA